MAVARSIWGRRPGPHTIERCTMHNWTAFSLFGNFTRRHLISSHIFDISKLRHRPHTAFCKIIQTTCYRWVSSGVIVKVNFTLKHATKAQRGGWSMPLLCRFTPRIETCYPLYRRLVGPQGQSGRVRKNSPSTGIRSPDRPSRSESLYRLRYPGLHPMA